MQQGITPCQCMSMNLETVVVTVVVTANSQVMVGDNNLEVAKCVSPSPDDGLYDNVYTNTIHSGRQGKQLHPKDPYANESYTEGHIFADCKVENGRKN